MSAGSGEEALNSRHACSACKHQRRKCGNHCVFAPHFPTNRANYFREVHKIFGVKNVTVILENLSPQYRKKAVESLEWEAFAWKEDPIEGPLGLFRKLEKELELLKNQQNPMQNIIVPYSYQNFGYAGIVANTNINGTNFGYAANNPNLVLDVPMNVNYSGYLQRADNIENQGLDNYIPANSFSYPIPQGQGRSAILQERGLDVGAQTASHLPKQEILHRNQILGGSAMRPAANSFNQTHHQRGSQLQGRVHAYHEGPVNGSQGRGLL
ncbi:hypothetical protein REPUB_Repub13aG0237900 [Reevesia pubescens]